MRVRAPVFGLLALLAGCTSADQPAKPPAGAETIACATGGTDKFDGVCWVERRADVVIVRHPDGGFRRFTVLTDGRGLEPADGADKAASRLDQAGFLELHVGEDGYRFPVAVKGDAGAK